MLGLDLVSCSAHQQETALDVTHKVTDIRLQASEKLGREDDWHHQSTPAGSRGRRDKPYAAKAPVLASAFSPKDVQKEGGGVETSQTTGRGDASSRQTLANLTSCSTCVASLCPVVQALGKPLNLCATVHKPQNLFHRTRRPCPWRICRSSAGDGFQDLPSSLAAHTTNARIGQDPISSPSSPREHAPGDRYPGHPRPESRWDVNHGVLAIGWQPYRPGFDMARSPAHLWLGGPSKAIRFLRGA